MAFVLTNNFFGQDGENLGRARSFVVHRIIYLRDLTQTIKYIFLNRNRTSESLGGIDLSGSRVRYGVRPQNLSFGDGS